MITGIILKLTIGLTTVLMLTRWMGKKELSQANPIYFLYAIILGGIVEETIYDEKVSPFHMGIAFITAVLFFIAIENLTYRNKRAERLIKGDKDTLIINGKVNEKVKEREKLTDQDIQTLLREKDIHSIDEVDIAYLETSGKLTVKKK